MLGTRNLIAAAQAAQAGDFVAQSVAWPLAGEGGRAVEEHERIVLAIGGVVLRLVEDLVGPTWCVEQLEGPARRLADRHPRIAVVRSVALVVGARPVEHSVSGTS